MSAPIDTDLADRLMAHAEQVVNDACNAEDQGLWNIYCHLMAVISYLRYGPIPPRGRDGGPVPGRPPWKGSFA